jgi:hypothetical protein
MTTPSADQPASEPTGFFMTTASLLPPGHQLTEMGEFLTFTKSCTYPENGLLDDVVSKLTTDTIQNLGDAAYGLYESNGVIGVTFSHVVDPVDRTITAVAIGTPVRTCRVGSTDA